MLVVNPRVASTIFFKYNLLKMCNFADGEAPPRPPPPASVQMGQYMHPSRPPPPDTDDEAEFMFENAPDPSQGPIMVRLCVL